MIEAAWVDDVQIHAVPAGSTALSKVRGLGSPTPRADVGDRARAHGVVDNTRHYGGRVVDLVGRCKAASTGELHDVLEDLEGLFALDGTDHIFKFQRQGRAFAERLTFQVASAFDYELVGKRRSITWAVSLLAPDPRIYADALRLASYDPTVASTGWGLTFPLDFALDFGAVSGNALYLVNEGNYWTPPIWTVRGPGRGMTIVNELTGETIAIDAELLASDFVVIDVATRSVKHLGTTERPDLINAGQTTWWEIPKGTTPARLQGSGFQTGVSMLEVAYRDGRI